MLVSPTLERYYFSCRLQFSCTNNIVEYEALIQGLLLAQKRGTQELSVYGDSKLIIYQVRNQKVTKNGLLKSYIHRVWDFLEGFNAFNTQRILRKENKHDDTLVVVGASYDIPKNIEAKKKQKTKVVVRLDIPSNNTNWQVFEFDAQIVSFLQSEAKLSERN